MAAQHFDIIQHPEVKYTVVVVIDGNFSNLSAEKSELQIANVYASGFFKRKVVVS